MDHPASDAGAQFVLDNRKLIVGFALLIVLCGTFFVIGFMEGKRQGVQRAKEQLRTTPSGENAAADLSASAQDRTVKGDAKPLENKSVRDQLDWYKSVNRREEAGTAPVSEPHKKGSASAAKNSVLPPAPPAGKPEPVRETHRAAAQKTSYSVQVGAFRLRREAEAKAAALKAAGYDYQIEPTGAAEPLFLLKVGRFDSRAAAVAMQLKLKKDGFATFVKTN